ncbi:hypothetical protein AB0N16_04630 [Streptomyces sp. NPDC051105]|uniref:hypothetical protein n=1 Tax=Streptomyces sp. NPDC051105 TaxID=3154843 RepID=UPI00342F62B6
MQDTGELVDDDRAAGDVSGEGGTAGNVVTGPVQGFQEVAELLALMRVRAR